mgnify:CR=1 FL=1
MFLKPPDNKIFKVGGSMAEEKQLIKKTKKRQLDIGLLIVTLILLALGVIMVLSASAPSAFRLEGDSYFYFKSNFPILNNRLGSI